MNCRHRTLQEHLACPYCFQTIYRAWRQAPDRPEEERERRVADATWSLIEVLQ